MRFRILVGAFVFALLIGMPNGSMAESSKVFKWNMQTLFPGTTLEHKVIADGAKDLKAATNGRLDIKVVPAGTFVKNKQMLEALGKRIFDAAALPTGFLGHEDPGFPLLFTIPGVWHDPRQVAIWFHHFGGQKLLNEGYAKHNVLNIGPIFAHAEGFFSKKPIEGLDSFKGMKVRTPPGLTSMMFQSIGANPVPMGGGEIYTALDTGVVDGAEFVSLESNYKMGFHEVTKYVLWPGFHSPITMDDISVNMDAWKELPDDLKQAFRYFAASVGERFDLEVSAADYGALEKLQAAGLKHVRLSAGDRAKVKTIGLKIMDDWSKKSDLAGKVAASVRSYLTLTGE